MIYIFHDYEWNEYILNDTIHGAADSRDYLFDFEIPDSIKWNHWTNDPVYTDSVSLSNNWENNNQHESWNIKDNQISLENIMSDLWIDSEDNNLVISVSNDDDKNDWTSYSIKEKIDDSTLIIEKEKAQNDEEGAKETPWNDESLTAKSFSYIKDWRVIPILVPWDDLQIKEYNDYLNNNSVNETWNWYAVQKINKNKSEWPTIIDDYADCMTPRWYKIVHWDSILAYKQLDNAPDICNIERRYCRNGKLSDGSCPIRSRHAPCFPRRCSFRRGKRQGSGRSP